MLFWTQKELKSTAWRFLITSGSIMSSVLMSRRSIKVPLLPHVSSYTATSLDIQTSQSSIQIRCWVSLSHSKLYLISCGKNVVGFFFFFSLITSIVLEVEKCAWLTEAIFLSTSVLPWAAAQRIPAHAGEGWRLFCSQGKGTKICRAFWEQRYRQQNKTTDWSRYDDNLLQHYP